MSHHAREWLTLWVLVDRDFHKVRVRDVVNHDLAVAGLITDVDVGSAGSHAADCTVIVSHRGRTSEGPCVACPLAFPAFPNRAKA